MHKIAFEPKELFTLWVNGSGISLEEIDLERRDYTCAPLTMLLSGGS